MASSSTARNRSTGIDAATLLRTGNADVDAAEHNSDELRAQADDAYEERRRKRVPYKSILLAVFLFVLGTILIGLSVVFLRRSPVPENAYPLLILGLLTFVPGLYASRIALWAYFGYADFSFDDLPGFD
jgi:hypothetical protein